VDGIDGLAGCIGGLAAATFGMLFIVAGQLHLAIIAFAIAGALLAFLKYNFSPARIYMGAGGSLVVGLLLSVLCIQFIRQPHYGYSAHVSVPAIPLAVAVLIVPIVNTVRVIVQRSRKGHSTFRADRNHLHHLLTSVGFTHTRATLLLCTVNMSFILIVFPGCREGFIDVGRFDVDKKADVKNGLKRGRARLSGKKYLT
jgi:UDP-GlcNAc:undecaprenyl-phosphate/decaprenyl-phosphate GlcNAc-1-phosphate transferase